MQVGQSIELFDLISLEVATTKLETGVNYVKQQELELFKGSLQCQFPTKPFEDVIFHVDQQ